MQATLERLQERREGRGGEGGFTLIELLIVIVILAILAAIVVFAVQNMTGSSSRASCESDTQTVDHAIQAYLAQMNKQPATVGDLLNGPVLGANGDQVGPWLHANPINGNHYAVAVTTVSSVAYAEVVVPPGTANFTNSYIYEPNGVAAAGTAGAPGVATTVNSACAGSGS